MYLNDSPGEFIVDSQTYPIQANTGFVFNEGVRHETQHTGSVPRLLLGPMNELAEPVGVDADPGVYYYLTEAAADLGGVPYASNALNNYTVQKIAGYTYWMIANTNNGTENINDIFAENYVFNNEGSLGVGSLNTANYTLFPYRQTPGVYYYSTKAAAETGAGAVTYEEMYDVKNKAGITSWMIATGSVGTSSGTFSAGASLNADSDTAYYYLYPAEAPCFLEGSTVLCQVDGADKYVPVEQLKKGTLVKTSLHGYKPVVLIGKGKISNPGNTERTENRLYKCSPSKYPELTKDLFITGCHSILEFPITEKQKEDITKRFGRLFVTDRKYRLMACVDDRAEPWNSKGTYTIWHFALEHENEGMNYGVYANGKLLVETCCIQTLRNKSNMTLLG